MKLLCKDFANLNACFCDADDLLQRIQDIVQVGNGIGILSEYASDFSKSRLPNLRFTRSPGHPRLVRPCRSPQPGAPERFLTGVRLDCTEAALTTLKLRIHAYGQVSGKAD
jgi:hypothetical protein